MTAITEVLFIIMDRKFDTDLKENTKNLFFYISLISYMILRRGHSLTAR